MSGKVHSEHIVARGLVGWVSGKVHSEHIVATKVLMPMGGGGVGCPGKCTLSTLLLQKSTILKIGWDPPPPPPGNSTM